MSGPEGKGVFCMEFVGARRCSYVQRRSKKQLWNGECTWSTGMLCLRETSMSRCHSTTQHLRKRLPFLAPVQKAV